MEVDLCSCFYDCGDIPSWLLARGQSLVICWHGSDAPPRWWSTEELLSTVTGLPEPIQQGLLLWD